MAWETRIQSQVKSYQRLKKWYLMQHYKVQIKGKVEQSRERSCAPPLHFCVVAIEKGAFGSSSTTVTNFTLKFHLFSKDNYNRTSGYCTLIVKILYLNCKDIVKYLPKKFTNVTWTENLFSPLWETNGEPKNPKLVSHSIHKVCILK